MNVIYIALGSNQGERYLNLQNAIEKMSVFLEDMRVSSYFETPAEGMAEGHDFLFLNGVVQAKTRLSAMDLLNKLLEVEQQLGRTRTESEFYLARIIDLDLLLFNDEIISSEKLVIPHPRMTERKFVMQPLNELAPELIIPGFSKSVNVIFKELCLLQES